MPQETELVAALKAHAGLTALVSTRIYPATVGATTATTPFVVYRLIGSDVRHALGPDAYELPTFRLDIVASGLNAYAQCTAIADAIKAALVDLHGLVETERDTDAEDGLARRTLDIEINPKSTS